MYHSFFTLCPKIKPYLPTKCPPAHISKCQNCSNCDWWHKKLSDGAVICADNGKQQFQGNCIDVSNSQKRYKVVCWYTCFIITYHLFTKWCTVARQCVRSFVFGNISARLGVIRELLIKWLS